MCAACSARVQPRSTPDGVLEQRVRVHGQDHPAVHLEVGGARLVHAEHRRLRGALGRLAGPGQRCLGRRVSREGERRVHGLGSGHEHHVEVAPADGAARVVHQRLRRVAADGRSAAIGAARPSAVKPEAARPPAARGLMALPAEQAPRTRRESARLEQGRVRRGGRWRRRRAVACPRPAARRAHGSHGELGPARGGRPGRGARIRTDRAVYDLPHADDDRGAGVEGHGRGAYRLTPEGAVGPPVGWRVMRVALGSDHAGFALKEVLKGALAALGHQVLDLGTFDGTTSVDYPDFGAAVGRAVRRRRRPTSASAPAARASASPWLPTRCPATGPPWCTTSPPPPWPAGTTTPTSSGLGSRVTGAAVYRRPPCVPRRHRGARRHRRRLTSWPTSMPTAHSPHRPEANVYEHPYADRTG